MTTDEVIGRRGERLRWSVRQRLAAIPQTRWVLLSILAIVVIVHGWRALLPFYIRGDLFYHWGLTNTILLGSFPPDGPYLGLPAYYPPAFHLLLAGLASLPGLDVRSATMLVGILWLPVIPLGAYLLTRRITSRTDAALVAAALTAFAGGFDLSIDRLWVNSMSMAGQIDYPIYPRDLVFGVLPFAMLAFLRALDGRRWVAWAALAGVLLGLCGLIQLQLLLPTPIALLAGAVVVARSDPSRRRLAAASLVISGFVALALVMPWLVYIAGTIARNGGVSIESSEDLLPVRIGFWNYPIQFGIVLPLAIAGAGLVSLWLARRSRTPAPDAGGWAPRAEVGGALLLAWWSVPFALAVLYQPTWPLEDALRPQRLWLVASQPGLVLAAIGLVALVERVRARPGAFLPARAARSATAIVVVVVLVASVPTTAATARLMTFLWTRPQYAHLQFQRDRVPDMWALLDVGPPRPTVLTYEDWSSLVWYETGAAVVAVEPPGHAKLAFDPMVFTRRSQEQRRTDLAVALAGDVGRLVDTADRYGADRILLARRDGSIGLYGQPGSLAANLGAVQGPSAHLQGNGWDALVLEPGSSLILPIADGAGAVGLEIRAATEGRLAMDGSRTDGAMRLRVGDGSPVDLSVPALPALEFSLLAATVDRPPGAPIVIEALDRIVIQGIGGFVSDPGPPPGWFVETDTVDAVVWRRSP